MRIPSTILRIATVGALFAGLGSVALAAVSASAVAVSAAPHSRADFGTWQAAARFRGDLSAVSADSSTDAWAVGGALTLHWNGKAWSKVAQPVATAGLSSVKAFSKTNAWAVGMYCAASCSTNEGTFSPLVLHWNGAKWSKVAVPKLAGAADSSLAGVAGVSASNLWAVGDYVTGSGGGGTLALHWNGAKWTRVAAPGPGADGQTYIYGVSAGSGTSAWAVGEYIDASNADRTLTLHWNGKKWSKIPSPNPGTGADGANALYGVSALSGTSAWAVGSYCVTLCQGANVNERSLVLHWNGKTWAKIASPNPSKQGMRLTGVTAVSGTVAWAGGMSCRWTASSAACIPYVLRWNGKQWASAATSVPRSPGANMISGLDGLSAKNAWAVGSRCASGCTGISTPVDNTLILHWNGKSWS